ncbi:hypothetical protein Sala_2587 [Sphingopyxis alaskensis RB2256]|uniref:Uncharacterized protein n=2 Tax=Sphingopyxis alaskensis TaxID=117207 RepID=Q1GPX9_SPHAL|nr:hypothetical protein Sala_2587 [Sphingopyxis alaskensis RB2256]
MVPASHLREKGTRKTVPASLAARATPWARAPAPTATLWHKRFVIANALECMEGRVMAFCLKRDGLSHRIAPSRRFATLLVAIPFAGVLVGCSGPERAENSEATTNTNVSVQMPPAIVASHTYRCVGGDVLYVDFLADETSIIVRRAPSGPSLRLTAPAQGLAYVGERMNLTLDGKDIKLDEPKKPSQACKRA